MNTYQSIINNGYPEWTYITSNNEKFSFADFSYILNYLLVGVGFICLAFLVSHIYGMIYFFSDVKPNTAYLKIGLFIIHRRNNYTVEWYIHR